MTEAQLSARVLLLEDSTLDAELIEELLKKSLPGLVLTHAATEDEFRVALDDCPDLILSDYQLLGFHGHVALEMARARCPETPVIFVTGSIGEDNAVALLREGATDHVSKLRLERLPMAITRALREVDERRQRTEAARHDREQLEIALDTAEEASRARDRFLTRVSHELRNPLAPILSAVHLLRERLQLEPVDERLLSLIERNIALEARLIEDLLSLSALTTGKITMRSRRQDLHAICVAAADSMQSLAADRRMRIELDLKAPTFHVWGDEARLQQVLLNLLGNALKFSSDDSVVRLESDIDPEGRCIHVRCIDYGIGLTPDELRHLFQPFQSPDLERRPDQAGGLGLGLAIAHGLIQQHGGRLTAKSDGPGRGARLTVTLPLAIEPTVEQAPAAADDDLTVMAGTTILLVEDYEDSLEAMQLLLERAGYQVEGVASLAAAMARLACGGIDAVVTDLGLPDGSGVEIAGNYGEQLPVIALTGYDRSLVPDAKADRLAAYITKPVKPAELMDAIGKALAVRGPGLPRPKPEPGPVRRRTDPEAHPPGPISCT